MTDELAIAKNVSIAHDEARIQYALRKNTVANYAEFIEKITDYYNHHVSRCILHGGYLSRTEAAGRAKQALDQDYRRRGGNLMTAFKDASDGTAGGLRVVLDRLSESLKAESVEMYIREAFDRYVAPSSWEEKVDIMRQFIARFEDLLSSSIRADQPERYAFNFEELIRSYIDSLRKTSSIFRRF
jgi:hypothetical protein